MLAVKALALSALCLALPGGASQEEAPSQREAPPSDAPGGKSFQIRVDMVSLPVVVTTAAGGYVTDLRREDFRVLDDGVPQEIAAFASVEEPVSVALMLDTSDSMRKHEGIIRNEATRFVGFLKKEDRLAILSFNDDVVLWEPFSLYGNKNPAALGRMDFKGMSAVYEAVWLGLEQVLRHEYGRKALVVFSDGIDTRSRTVTEEETLRLARETEAAIYAVCFRPAERTFGRFPAPGGGGASAGNEAGRAYLARLAGSSGGTLAEARKTDDLSTAFRKIARELSSRYSIGYYPSNLERNGAFHRVEVRLKRNGYTVRTREGYYAPRP